MATLFNKKEPLTPKEYIVKYSLIYHGMKKVKDEAIKSIMESQKYVKIRILWLGLNSSMDLKKIYPNHI